MKTGHSTAAAQWASSHCSWGNHLLRGTQPAAEYSCHTHPIRGMQTAHLQLTRSERVGHAALAQCCSVAKYTALPTPHPFTWNCLHLLCGSGQIRWRFFCVSSARVPYSCIYSLTGKSMCWGVSSHVLGRVCQRVIANCFILAATYQLTFANIWRTNSVPWVMSGSLGWKYTYTVVNSHIAKIMQRQTVQMCSTQNALFVL